MCSQNQTLNCFQIIKHWGSLEISKVGSRNLVDATRALHAKVQDRPSIKEYPITQALNDAQKHYDALLGVLTEVDAWRPVLEWSKEKSKLQQLMSEYKLGASAVWDYRTIILKVKDAALAEKQSQARKQRNKRDVYVDAFKEEGYSVQDCVAKSVGDSLFHRIETPGTYGITTMYQHPILNKDAGVDIASFGFPRLLFPENEIDDAKVSHWHTECAKRINENSIAAGRKSDSALQSMRQSRIAGAAGSIECANGFKWDPAFTGHDEPYFQAPSDLRLIVNTAYVGHSLPAFR